MADYEQMEKELSDIIGEGNRYFNSLNFARKSLTFIPDKNGSVIRRGVNGYYAIPSIPALSCGEIVNEKAEGWFECNGLNAETPFYSVVFASDGSIVSLKDKELGREWVKGDFNKLKIYHDTPGNYDAWDILPNYKDKQENIVTDKPLELLKYDDECAEFSATLVTAKSRWQRIIRLFRRSRGIEVENIVDWNEKHRLAKVEFDCNVLSRELVCDTSAGFIRRETHRNTSWQQARFEVCHHKWCDMSEHGGGVALINQGKYGVSAENNVMALSLLRATIRPDPTSDIGSHDFCYMIYPHQGDFVDAGINNVAFEYNVPLVKADVECGFSFSDKLWLQSLKLSENGSMIVARLSEQNGERGTLVLPQKAKILNMLEDEIGAATEIEYAPFEIITLGFEL